VFRSGDVFGELFLMTSTRRIFSAQTLTETTVYTMTEAAFDRLMSLRQDVRRDFIKHLVWQQRRAVLRLEGLLHVKAGPRVLSVLLDLGERLGQPTSEGWRLSGAVTQSDLAKMVGLNRSTVSTHISYYRRQRILTGHTRVLVIHKARARAALEAAGVSVL
jgi:CRP-like cAMP-binding protein